MPQPYSIVFAGTPQFAVPALEALANDSRFDVKLVISQPDKPVGRKRQIKPTPVKAAAKELGLEIAQPNNINTFDFPLPAFDFLVVVAYGQILKEHILAAPQIAPVNLHASLLPRWRGASPMHSAILHDDRETGVTVQRMVKELDSGPILGRQAHPLNGTETIAELHDVLAHMGAKLLTDTLAKPLHETPQAEREATICHKLNRDMGTLDPLTMTAEEVDRHIRALVPWPGVTIPAGDKRIKVLAASLTEVPHSVPLICKDSVLHLVTVQPPGKAPMPADDWQRGQR